MSELKAVKSKIAKLIAMGNSNSLQEAEIAMNKAMSLMSEWGLEMSDIELANQDIVLNEIDVGSKRRPEINGVLVALAEFCAVKVWSCTASKWSDKNRRINTLGYQEDNDLFEYFWAMLNRTYTTEFAAFQKSDAYAEENAFRHGRVVRSNFRNGFVSSVNYLLEDLTEEMETSLKSKSGTALIPMKMKNIDDFFTNEMNIRLTTSYGSRSGSGNGGAGYGAGYRVGGNVNFNSAVGGSTSRTRLLT